MNPIAVRLLSEQLSRPQFSQPGEVVSHFGAMQAQDYRMMRWAVVMRLLSPSGLSFRKAFDEGAIVRLHLLRGTWQLVAAEDYPWMLRLFAAKAERTVRGWMRANGVEVNEAELHAVRDVLMGECAARGSATKEDFAAALSRRGREMDAHRLSYHIRLAETGGVLCSGCLTPLRATYALTAERVKTPSTLPEKDEMLALLARKYFQSHAPATLEDYVWWSGLTRKECRRGMDALGAELRKEISEGREYYVHESCRERGWRRGHTHLLPPFDEYLIGYKNRTLVLAPEHAHRAHTKNGIFFPIIVHDGRVCGNWTTGKDGPAPTFFAPMEGEVSLSAQWEAFRSCF